MTDRKQTTETEKKGPINRLRVFFKGHTPHWKRYGGGNAYLEVTTHDAAKWVGLDATETAEESKAQKRTMLTLDEDAGRALLRQLLPIYAPEVAVLLETYIPVEEYVSKVEKPWAGASRFGDMPYFGKSQADITAAWESLLRLVRPDLPAAPTEES